MTLLPIKYTFGIHYMREPRRRGARGWRARGADSPSQPMQLMPRPRYSSLGKNPSRIACASASVPSFPISLSLTDTPPEPRDEREWRALALRT
jgi:hypothetical protein